MFKIRRSQATILSIAAMLALALSAPFAATAEEQILSAAPTGQSWDEISGYGSVESSRATIALLAAPAPITNQVPSDVRFAPAQAIAPGPAVDANRAATAVYEALAYGSSWEVSSGYRSVESSRVLAASHALQSDDLGYAEASRSASGGK